MNFLSIFGSFILSFFLSFSLPLPSYLSNIITTTWALEASRLELGKKWILKAKRKPKSKFLFFGWPIPSLLSFQS